VNAKPFFSLKSAPLYNTQPDAHADPAGQVKLHLAPNEGYDEHEESCETRAIYIENSMIIGLPCFYVEKGSMTHLKLEAATRAVNHGSAAGPEVGSTLVSTHLSVPVL
jgi:hypothetical protein